jgi:hypothetical protein
MPVTASSARLRKLPIQSYVTPKGDPAKAALAIDTALRSDKTPLRLQLGTDAVSSIRAHAE